MLMSDPAKPALCIDFIVLEGATGSRLITSGNAESNFGQRRLVANVDLGALGNRIARLPSCLS